MVRAAAVPSGRRARPLRTVATLMLAMLVVQLAAQWCAWHCGAVASPAGGVGIAGAGTSAVAPTAPEGTVAAGGEACGVEGWCELGQTPPLASAATPGGPRFSAGPGPAPPGPSPSFLLVPEERPPMA